MNIFGRKRYLARQEQRAAELDENRIKLNERVGAGYGRELFRMDCPRPAFEPADCPYEMAFRVALQQGYSEAEDEYEDEVGFWLHEQGATIVNGFERLLASKAGIDLDAQDIHGGGE